MARPSKNTVIDYAAAHDLTHGLIDRASCPDGLPFVLLRDADKKGLRLRVTKAGGKHWQFETRIKGKLFTRALGEWPSVSIEAAKSEAHRLRGLTEAGTDPRELEQQAREAKIEAETIKAEKAAQREQERTQQGITVSQAWNTYLAERRPHWGERHYQDHLDLADAGGVPFKRGKGTTSPGPLHSLMQLPLRELTTQAIEAWAEREAQTRPTQARLAWRCMKVFLTWCGENPQYAPVVQGDNPAKTKKARQALGKPAVKTDVLQRGQLAAWFGAVQQIQNPAISAYCQILLLTGARPGEVMTLRWNDINTQWKGIAIRDKVEGEREIPLTPYVHHLLSGLPRRNAWVFSSPASASGHLSDPTHAHDRACKSVGIDTLTFHGLRRSFKSLTEWLEVPVGVVAQIQGHKPSATAEKHYTVRPLDLLRVHHEKIEAWILEQAGIKFDASAVHGTLRVVAG